MDFALVNINNTFSRKLPIDFFAFIAELIAINTVLKCMTQYEIKEIHLMFMIGKRNQSTDFRYSPTYYRHQQSCPVSLEILYVTEILSFWFPVHVVIFGNEAANTADKTETWNSKQ